MILYTMDARDNNPVPFDVTEKWVFQKTYPDSSTNTTYTTQLEFTDLSMLATSNWGAGSECKDGVNTSVLESIFNDHDDDESIPNTCDDETCSLGSNKSKGSKCSHRSVLRENKKKVIATKIDLDEEEY